MIASAFGDFLSSIFGLDSLSEDLIKYLVYTALGAVFWRLVRMMNGWKGWKTSRKKEIVFWLISLPMMFAIVTFAAGLGGARGGKFKIGVLWAGPVATPKLVADSETNRTVMTMPGIGGSKKLNANGATPCYRKSGQCWPAFHRMGLEGARRTARWR